MTRKLEDLRHLVRAPIVNGDHVYFRPEAVLLIEQIGMSGNTRVTLSDGSTANIEAPIATVARQIDEAIRRDLAAT